jgi:hypothetical protein
MDCATFVSSNVAGNGNDEAHIVVVGMHGPLQFYKRERERFASSF